jgi:CubicO group peptidase (beta-lactamase class C family)
MRPSRYHLAALATVFTLVSARVHAQPAPLEGLDDHITRSLQAFGVPGAAVAVVKDGRVVLAKGYGVRRVGTAEAVDADTLFGIASNTKAFTSTALAILAEEGRVRWDDPVTRHLPAFQMYDPWVSREVTLRDLVSHRAGLGLGAGDLLWWPGTDVSRAEIVAAIRHLKPASSMRSRYAYNNAMFVVAGEVVAAVSGASWDAFVQQRILSPLGMTRTATGASVLSTDRNVAAPHLGVAGTPLAVEPVGFDNAAAAAGISSSASDLARWMAMLLECSGQPAAGATCVLKPEGLQELWRPAIAQRSSAPPPALRATRANFTAYALGFGLRDYRGRKVVTHGGALPGYVSRVTLVPEERLGLAILTNQEEDGAYMAIQYRVLDAYLGAPAPPVDWVAAFKEERDAAQEKSRQAEAKASAARVAGTKPSLPLESYAGRYRDAWYGDAAIEKKGDRLVLRLLRTPRMVADLEHWQHDTFVARWRERFMSDTMPAEAYVTFALKPDASIERMTLAPVSPAIDFSFDYADLLFVPVPAEAASR